MGTRRQARELAMQALFFMDARRDFSPAAFERFCANFRPKPEERPFFLRLVAGVLGCRRALDALIERFSENWSLERMSGVDRNVMRIAVYELLCCRDIPAKVAINEAVDIGKKFGTEESGAFINGIIDSIREAAEAGALEFPCEEGEEEGGRLALASPPPAVPSPEAPPAAEAAARPRRRRKSRPAGAVVRRKKKSGKLPEGEA